MLYTHHLNPQHNPRGADYCDLHFTDEEVGAQSPSCLTVAERRLGPRQRDTCLRLSHAPRPIGAQG